MKISRNSEKPPKITNPRGEIIQEILGLEASHVESHSLAQVTIPPGNSSVPHYHKNSEESYLILSGKATMSIDQRDFELETGEAVLIEPNEVHVISNDEDQNLVFLAVCVPAWHPEDSFAVDESEIA